MGLGKLSVWGEPYLTPTHGRLHPAICSLQPQIAQWETCLYTANFTHEVTHIDAHTRNILIHYERSILSLLVHTSSSSFTWHLPPSRRDWTSCNLPSSAARSRSLSSDTVSDAWACVIEVAYSYSMGEDGSYQGSIYWGWRGGSEASPLNFFPIAI